MVVRHSVCVLLSCRKKHPQPTNRTPVERCIPGMPIAILPNISIPRGSWIA